MVYCSNSFNWLRTLTGKCPADPSPAAHENNTFTATSVSNVVWGVSKLAGDECGRVIQLWHSVYLVTRCLLSNHAFFRAFASAGRSTSLSEKKMFVTHLCSRVKRKCIGNHAPM